MSLKVSDELTSALKKVRSDASPENWVLASYNDDTTELLLRGTGSNGVEEMKDLLLDKDVCYGLVRTLYDFEKVGVTETKTTYFTYIYYYPDGVPLQRKMRIGKFDGQVKKTFAPYHTDLEIDKAEEISEPIMKELIAKITQTANKVTEKKSTSMFFGGNRLSWKKGTSNKPKVAKGANVTFENEEELKDAIADVRDDSSSTRWCLATYTSKTAIAFSGKGDGTVSDMLQHCSDTAVSYGLFRIEERFDSTTAIKFCFVVFTPNVPPMVKATIATHRGTVTPVFRPYHQDFSISDVDELTEEIALEKISGLTGSRSHVTNRKIEKVEKKYERKFLGGVTSQTAKLEFENKEDLLVAIADVRNDSSGTNFVVAGFEGERKNLKLALTSSGSGGINEMVDSFNDSKVMYGLLRNEEVIDRSTVVKFYLFAWQGENVSATTRGNTGVFSGAVNAVFSPYHDDIHGSTVDELIAAAQKKIKNLKV